VTRPLLYVDFNEMVESDLVLLSQADTKLDVNGKEVALREGLLVDVYTDDVDEHGNPDNLVASGVVERNQATDWSAHVKWLCRVDHRGIKSQSDL
jgi:hypothetical protein